MKKPDENLRRRFPQSPRLILQRSAWAILAFGLCLFALAQYVVPAEGIHSDFVTAQTAFILVVMLGCAARLVFEVCEYFAFSYAIESSHLTVSGGLLSGSRSSIHLGQVSDVIISRGPIEVFFQLYSVELLILNGRGMKAAADIPGLARKRALELRAYLLRTADFASSSSRLIDAELINANQLADVMQEIANK